MKAQNRKSRDNAKRSKRQLHTKWAQKFISLYQCKLSNEDRQQLEAHLKECKVCADAYLVYKEVAGIIQDRLPLEVPSELSPMLQALKEEQLALSAQFSRTLEPPAKPKQTLTSVTGDRSKKKHPA